MSSLADLPELVGFFSYSREDDADSHGALSALRSRIQGELRGQLGRTAKTFRLWQDKEAIPSGTLWETEIGNAVAQAIFFIPIITPTVIASPYCRFELDSFLAREAALGRSDLVFPILYIQVPALEDSLRRQNDAVLSLIAKRQYIDWREFRHLDSNSTEVKRAVERFCGHIRDALYRPWVSPEERKQQEEDTAREKAEAERERREFEAKRRAEEEARQRATEEQRLRGEAEAEQRAEEAARREKDAAEVQRIKEAAAARRLAEERRQNAEEEKRRAEEEGRVKQERAAARQRAEDERRARETEAKQRADQERTFAAAKRADTVGALDEFLAAYPESHLAAKAKALRPTLVERDDALKGAMSGDDPGMLRAFLDHYPASKPAAEVRSRLRQLEPRQPPRRATLIGGGAVGVAVLAAIGIWLAVPPTRAPVASAPPAPVAPPPAPVTSAPAAPVTPPPAPVTSAPPVPVTPALAPVTPAPPAPVTPTPAPVTPAQATATPLSPQQERALKPGETFQECTGCPQMVVVQAGNFMMGSPGGQGPSNEHPQHNVTIGKPFAVAKFELTFTEWDACVADGGCNGWNPGGRSVRGQEPMIDVNWDNATAYVAWLSKKVGQPYRLLSEAEYEYAARAGTTTAYPWGDDIKLNGQAMANCKDCGSQWDDKQTAPVGSFPPNKFGLYDMVGNVWEWTEDCWRDTYSGAPTDGSAWTSGDYYCGRHVVRGGTFNYPPAELRSALRFSFPTTRYAVIGFRVARTLLAP